MNSAVQILNAFEAQPPKLSSTAEPYQSYPKYLPKYKLLALQIQDPKFCLNFLLQLLILFESLLKPVSPIQKKYFVFNEPDKRNIEQFIERIYKVFARIKANSAQGLFENTIKHLAIRENNVWANWKEYKGANIPVCVPFEMTPSAEIQKKFDEARLKTIKKLEKGVLHSLDIMVRKESKSKTDKLSLFGTTSKSDFSEILAIPISAEIPENPYDPAMGELIERVCCDLDPNQGIEKEFRAKNDHVFYSYFNNRIGICVEIIKKSSINRFKNIF